jgi:hypothetical protein
MPIAAAVAAPAAAVERSRDFIQHERCRDKPWAGLHERAPVPDRRKVMLVVGCFERDQVSRIDGFESAAP